MCALQGKRGGAPEIVYGSVVDYYAAALVAAGVASALFERERSGQGQYVGVSLLRSALTMQSARLVWAEGEARDIGRDMRSGGITGLHPTREGYLYSRPTRRTSGRRCARRPACASSRTIRATTPCASARNTRPRSCRSCAMRCMTRTALEWEQLFGDEVPCAAARRVEDMFDHPQVLAEEIVAQHRASDARQLPRRRAADQVRPHARPAPFAAPALGQDTQVRHRAAVAMTALRS